jgi:hypothetical protein
MSRRSNSSFEGGQMGDAEKGVVYPPEYAVHPPEDADSQIAESGSHDLHRGLKARHITMIAIGGAVGTGLIIGTCVGQSTSRSAGATISNIFPVVLLLHALAQHRYSFRTQLSVFWFTSSCAHWERWLPGCRWDRVSLVTPRGFVIQLLDSLWVGLIGSSMSWSFRSRWFVQVTDITFKIYHCHSQSVNSGLARTAILGGQRKSQSGSVDHYLPGRHSVHQLLRY